MVLAESKSETNVAELDLRSKPLKKRGLSRFYRQKAQSFASFESLITCRFGESSHLLAKRPRSASDEAAQPAPLCALPDGEVRFWRSTAYCFETACSPADSAGGRPLPAIFSA